MRETKSQRNCRDPSDSLKMKSEIKSINEQQQQQQSTEIAHRDRQRID